MIGGGFMFFKKGWTDKNIIANIANQSVSLGQLIWQGAGFDKEKTYLLLFQNNLEIRPSGGYIGNFGILKVKNGQKTFFESYDTTVFDWNNKNQTEPPLPIKKYLKVSNWQMRDSNWSADFPTSAKQAEYFYHLQGGIEQFDGIIAINADFLPALLKWTGPIYLKKYNKTFDSKNVLYGLEYEVEKGYVEKNIDISQRKAAFKELLGLALDKISKNNIWQLNSLKDLVLSQLDQKNIILNFDDENLQNQISKLKWDGQISKDYPDDYLMLIEANLGGRKSNYFMERSIEYFVDLDKEKPQAKLLITFKHNGKQNDWFNYNYLCYLQVYAPDSSWLEQASIAGMSVKDQTVFSFDFGKKVFGQWIETATAKEQTIEFVYDLPEKFKNLSEYKILIQKQSGIDQILIKIHIIKDSRDYFKETIITKDWQGAIKFQ